MLYEHHDLVGNPTHPLINPDILMSVYPPLNENPFYLRLFYFISMTFHHITYYLEYLPRADQVARKYFGNDMPYLGDVAKEYCSLLLMNINLATSNIRPNLPNVVEVGQIHIRKSKPLPKVSQ